MPDDGTPSATPQSNGATPSPSAAPTGGSEWTSSLPPDVRGHAALSDVKDVGDLATRYVKLNKPFAEQLPERIRGEAAFKDIKSIDALADSYYNAQKMIGVPKDQLLRLPSSDKPEDWAPVYNRLGRPEKAGDYKLTVPQGFPPAEKEYAESVMAAAHGAGLSQKQFETMTGWLYERASQALAAKQASADGTRAQRINSLKTEWGQAFDNKVDQARSAMSYYADKAGITEELKQAMDETGAGDHPVFIKLFNLMGVNLHEDGALTGKAFGAGALQSPVEAQQQINALRGDAAFMKNYTNQNKRDPAHIEAVGKMEALYKLAFPEGQAA
jgi:hypothetical protein